MCILQKKDEYAYLLIDGLWFGRWFVLMVYRQSKTLLILHISIAGREVGTKIARDLRVLKEPKQYHFSGVVSDGGTGIMKAVDEIYPHIPHQICLAHMHRRIMGMLGKRPKDEKIQNLKVLADHVWFIESHEALNWWKDQLRAWINKHWMFLLEKTVTKEGKWWFTHKGARRAVSMMLKLPDTSFVFLDHPLIPKTTNELEAQLGHIGKRWAIHQGLKKERWEDFLKWFVYFYNEEKISQSRTKED